MEVQGEQKGAVGQRLRSTREARPSTAFLQGAHIMQ